MKMLDGDPRWKHRRRLVYSTITLAVGMIVFGAFVWRDGMVASELVRSGTALITLVLTSYVWGASLDDRWQRRDDAPTDY